MSNFNKRQQLKGHENTSVNYLEYTRMTDEERQARMAPSQLLTTTSPNSSQLLRESNLSQKSENMQSQKSILSE